MLTFAEPWLLLLLPLGPLFAWWWLRRRRPALRLPAAGRLGHLPPGRSQQARWAGALLRGLAFTLLVLAMAGPRWPDRTTRIKTEGIALVMLIDVSGSMAETDFTWPGEPKPISRLEAVRRAFGLFVAGGEGPDGTSLPGRAEDLIGLVTFATRPDSPCPLTLGHSVLLRTLAAEKVRSVPGESETNISDAIVLGLHRLKSAGPRRRVLVLLSDGEHNVTNTASGWTPRQAAQVAANLGVSIYTIDAGGETTTTREKPPKGNEAPSDTVNRDEGIRTLQEVAAISRGRYFAARDTKSLLDVCVAIDRLERAEIESFQYRKFYEGYPWCGLTAFVMFGLVAAIEATMWRRAPA
jgi:Ca-activated chloride channel family protein